MTRNSSRAGAALGSTRWVAVRSLASALLLALSVAGQAAATPVEYAYTGVVTSLTDAGGLLAGSVMVGTTFTGTFAYDDSVPDTNANASFGRYEHPAHVGDFSLSLGPLSVSRANAGTFVLGIEDNTGVGDGFLLAPPSDEVALAGIASHFAGFAILFVDSSGQVFDSDVLPQALSLADFDFDQPGLDFNMNLVFLAGTDSVSIDGAFTSLVLVPEPGTGSLVATGCLALAAARRRSLRGA